MCRSYPALAVLLILLSCAHDVPSSHSIGNSRPTVAEQADGSLAAALVAGNEELARKLTDEIIAGRRNVSERELRDERSIAPNVLLRTTYGNRDYQLGVNTVSEYVLCALQIRHQTSSENILQATAPEVRERCSSTTACEVCNAQAFPVSAEVKKQLIEYWAARQD